MFIILTAAVLCSFLLGWLAFHSRFLNAREQDRTVWIVVSCLGVIPIFFYPSIAKRVPAMKVSLALIAASLVLASIGGIAFFAFDVDNIWTDGTRLLSQALVFAVLVLSIRQVRKKKDQEKNRETRDSITGE
jgi:predicted membrane channel-forming protein YqfA (hemolysin III family)